MQIACEKCSTTYTLDEKLLPPGGAPVQCTRCGHVFIALPDAEARRDRSGTQIFGIKAPPESGAGAAEEDSSQLWKSTTAMFGTAPAKPPAEAPRSTQTSGAVGAPAAAAPRSTQVFGAVGAQPPAGTPSASNPRATQVFGAVGAAPQQPLGAGSSPPPSNPRATQVFGAVSAPAQPPPGASSSPPASNPRATQVFGAVSAPAQQPLGASSSPPASNPRATQVFGAVSAPTQQTLGASSSPPASNPRATQVFGAVGGSPAPGPRATQVFGAVGAAPSPEAAAPARSTTAMFGAVPSSPAPSTEVPRSSTQLMGAVQPSPSPPARSSTQMMGVVQPGIAQAEPPRSSTQMMGVVQPGTAQAEPPRSSTQMMGVVQPGTAQAEPPRSSTQMMGVVQPGTAQAEPPRSSTQMMGVVQPAATPPPRTSTAMFGGIQVQPAGTPLPKITFGGGEAPATETSEATQTDAPTPFALADPKDIDPAMASTQQMKASDLEKAMAAYRAAEVKRLPNGAPPPAGAPIQLTSQPPRPGMTAELQLSGGHAPPAPGMTAEMQVQRGHAPPRSGMTSELQFGGGHLPPRPGMTAEMEVDHNAPTPLAGTPAAYAPVELPPEAPALEQLEMPGPAFPHGGRRGQKKGSGALIGGAIALLAIGGALFAFFATRPPAIPPEAAATREAAIVLLRRDDPPSRLRAISELERVIAANPTYLEAQADLVSALALQLDDTRVQQERSLGEVRVLEKEIERLTNAQSPSDWQNRVYVLGDEVNALRAEAPKLQEASDRYDQRLRNEHARLSVAVTEHKTLEPNAARVNDRARALYGSVFPAEDSLEKLRTYDSAGSSDGWSRIALAQFVLNSRSSEDVVEGARTGIEEVVQTDTAFIRAYVLAARIAIRQERYEAAATTLEAAVALNPDHQTARDLLEWAQASQRAVIEVPR